MNSRQVRRNVVRRLMVGVVITLAIINITACGNQTISGKPQVDGKENGQITQGIDKDKDKVEQAEKEDKKQENSIDEEASTGEAIRVDEEKPPTAENVSKDTEAEEKPSKPIIVPEPLSQDQLYAAYNNTLIIGDSRTEGFKMYSGVKNASYFCMKAMTIDKIVGGTTAKIDGRTVSVYDMLEAGTYDKIIIGVGLNELGWNHIETFLTDYGTLIDNIKEKQPNGVIYLQAVLPVTREKSESDKVHNNAQIYWYNENIITLAESKGVQYVNPAGAVVDGEGFLVAEATTDGVHLNSAYCKLWAEYLAQLI